MPVLRGTGQGYHWDHWELVMRVSHEGNLPGRRRVDEPEGAAVVVEACQRLDTQGIYEFTM